MSKAGAPIGNQSLSEIMEELDLLRLYLRYKISLMFASEFGTFKNADFPSVGYCNCTIFKSQIMSFEEFKKQRPTGTYLSISIE